MKKLKLILSLSTISSGLLALTSCNNSVKTIEFGLYPQTEVKATDKNGLASITFDQETWTDYGYYIEGELSSYMYYYDLDMDNDGSFDYRGVYFSSYRPYYTNTTSDTENSFQDNNSYNTESIYWFKYEPIKWNIIKTENGKSLLLSDLIIDAQDFCHTTAKRSGATDYTGVTTTNKIHSNNYMYSNIRGWLNTNFYNLAFNETEKAKIETTYVDNSSSAAGNSSASYSCNNTYDKLFLLSSEEAYYAPKKTKKTYATDYAKCQGIGVYNKNSYWLLRSPSDSYEYVVYSYDYNGNFYELSVTDTVDGIRTACWITL